MTTGPVVVVLGPAAVRDGRTTSCGAGYNDAVGVPFLLVAVTAFRVYGAACLPSSRSLARHVECWWTVVRDGVAAGSDEVGSSSGRRHLAGPGRARARLPASERRGAPHAWTVPGP